MYVYIFCLLDSPPFIYSFFFMANLNSIPFVWENGWLFDDNHHYHNVIDKKKIYLDWLNEKKKYWFFLNEAWNRVGFPFFSQSSVFIIINEWLIKIMKNLFIFQLNDYQNKQKQKYPISISSACLINMKFNGKKTIFLIIRFLIFFFSHV